MSRYAQHDAAGWIESNNAATNKYRRAPRRGKPLPELPEKLTPFQARVAHILGIVGGGIYNAPVAHDKINWEYGFDGVSVTWQHEGLATWDGSGLTALVFLCHEARIRCAIDPAGPHMLRLSFWQRAAEGGMSERHPNLNEAVEAFREWYKQPAPKETT
jgi:hypothetical protein